VLAACGVSRGQSVEGQTIDGWRIGSTYAAVFSRADGGLKAIGAGWPLTAHGVPVTIDYGP